MAASTSRARVGLGTKINFALTGRKGEIIETISWGIDGGDAIDATHMDVPPIDGDGIRTNAEMIPREIARLKPLTCTVHFDEALGLPQVNFQETVEIVLRRRANQLTPAKFSATGWVSNLDFDLPVDNKSVMRMTVSFTGNYTYFRPLLAA